MSHLHAVILAGGRGTRFWPLSRQEKPKQFLNILGRETLFQQTLSRIRPVVSPENIWVVTSVRFKNEMKTQLKGIPVPRSHLLFEPEGKNTAPAIAWAASRIAREDKNAVMAVLPSDHLIRNQHAFLKYLKEAVTLAERKFLVTMGIVPTRPETGYGYLRIKPAARSPFPAPSHQGRGMSLESSDSLPHVRGGLGRGNGGKKIWLVEKFTEKPSLPVARKFVAAKKYLWNSGMFVWRCDVILNEFERHLPAVHQCFYKKCDDASVRRIWRTLPGISIDYGILEKAADVATVPAADMGWSDLGSWEALFEILPRDHNGNVLRGNALALDCRNTMIMPDKRLIAAVGLDNLTIIDTPDAILICPTAKCQAVREIVGELQKRKSKLL